MPVIKSAKKRVKTASKATARNVKTKRTLRTAVKAFHKAITGNKSKAGEATSKAHSSLDKAAKKGLLHKNKVARKKSQLSKAAKAAGVKPTKSTKVKKAAPKKTVAKKPVTKKAVAKKTTAKKAAPKKKK